MGDAPPSSGTQVLPVTTMSPPPNQGPNTIDTTGYSSQDLHRDGAVDGIEAGHTMSSNAPFYAQLHAIPSGSESSQPPSNGPPMPGVSAHHLDMSSIASALPDAVQYHSPHPQESPFGGRGFSNRPPLGPTYSRPQFHSMGASYRPPSFSNGMPHSPLAGHPVHSMPGYPVYGTYQPFASQLSIPPQHLAFPPVYPSSYGRPENYSHTPLQPFNALDPRAFIPAPAFQGDLVPSKVDSGSTQRFSNPEPTPSYPRGPPRKPKQSGHALWVGNLPPGTVVTDLKDHFSREATKDIESLFLISKSNCAFVNYRSESVCSAAMSRFHDSRFNGVRLVCRLRRGSTTTTTPLSTSPYSEDPSSPTTAPEPSVNQERRQSQVVIASGSNAVAPVPDDAGRTDATNMTPRVPEKYFIVKSLTLQDLDASVRNGIWATQSHNEAILNKAFESAENVYLVFSANKSGEYFGYARMSSPISGEAVVIHPQARSQAQQPELPEATADGPKFILTPATEWAPKGRIVDDSARGTIFWEADLPEGAEDTQEEGGTPKEEAEQQVDGLLKQGQDWGKPFNIEWLSTNRLPFYRTRGLRNPWNANREVKIARDGTELEPSIGKRLVQMFHRPLAPVVLPQGIAAPLQQHLPQFQPY